MSCLMLCSASAQHMAFAELRADEAWNWTPASDQESAKASIAATGAPDLALAITFPAERGCYTADLMLTDREGDVLPSKSVTVTTGGEQFVLSASPSGADGVYEAPPPVFHALKRSRTLRLETPDANYSFSLAGSAAAINSAWNACEDDVTAGKADDRNTAGSTGPKAQTGSIAGDSMDGDSMDAEGDGEPGEHPISRALVKHQVLPIVVLMFAIGNAFLTLKIMAKTLALPPVSPPAGAPWRRSAVLTGAVGWIVLPLIFFAAYGLLGAVLVLAGYLIAGLMIAAVLKPDLTKRATERLIDWVRKSRLRWKDASRGSRLIVDGYRRIARQQAVAPTKKTTDAEILTLFERVGSAFKSVAYQRGESLQGSRINYIVWKFLQAHEAMSKDAFDAYLQQELGNYSEDGLPAAYRNDIKF
ncbi:MAG: hypothetical protein WBM40_04675 [Thiohalocapsa sp.]